MSQKLAVAIALMFCAFATVILVILYYPKDEIEKEFEDFESFTPKINIKNYEDLDLPKESDAPKYDLSSQLEEFGAAFVTLVAVGLVTVGLACVFCACCCVA